MQMLNVQLSVHQVNLEVNCVPMSAGEWADNLTNISVGDLLNEASNAANSERMNLAGGPTASCIQLAPLSCDSFDAAIAAHISDHRVSSISTKETQPSIWDAEETCDEFSFRMVPAETPERMEHATSIHVEDAQQISCDFSSGLQNFLKVCGEHLTFFFFLNCFLFKG